MKTLPIIKVSFVLSMLIQATPALALDAIQCTSLVSLPTGGVLIENRCEKKINMSFCVQNDKSSWACPAGRSHAARGTYDISPHGKIPIMNYSAQGGGRVNYIACFHPESPADWDLTRNSFKCR